MTDDCIWQPECAVLVDSLEQSACYPELAAVLAKSLLNIFHLSAEKTSSSFKILNAIPRVLKVACIQVQEYKSSANTFTDAAVSGIASGQSNGMSYSAEVSQSWEKCMKTFMDLFAEYSVSDDAKFSILSSSLCINCMFELFWEDRLRNFMLKHVLDLMKVCYSLISWFLFAWMNISFLVQG